ncbi:MAG: hydrogenase 4 subunit B [Gammaproteobacteria bacterium]|nr:hydrogenase 4 subunit B [Gammaproteobacteria bacterium]
MFDPIYAVLCIATYWFFVGIIGGVLLRNRIRCLRVIFSLGTLGSVFLLVTSSLSLNKFPSDLLLSIGIPEYPFRLHWDPLTGFFLILLSVPSLGISVFSGDYFRHLDCRTQGMICFNYHLFLASMTWVLIAADAYSFLIAWELMALSSYFLIVAFKSTQETQQAGFLYFLIAHIGALAILLSFALMLQGQTDFSFAAMRHAQLSPASATMVFLLALVGFGAKAGLLPFHVWLPEAHPAAPSPISALMSGVMLKMAVYGILRVAFDFLIKQEVSWGMTALIIGLLTALFGIILAAVQTDMKRLLAYSSIENLGLITAGLGLSILFNATNHSQLAVLTLVAVLFHCFNHALLKSLLFLGTGSVLHATGERNLGRLGGLFSRMPWVASLILIGVLAIAGVPMLNGFVSEWLLLQAFLFSPQISIPSLIMILPIAAAIIVFVIGLAAYVMVKFYGIIFLGKPRESTLTHAADASALEKCGLVWLVGICCLLGLFPLILLRPLTLVADFLLRLTSPTFSLFHTKHSWLFLVPIQAQRASYSPLVFFCVMMVIYVVLVILIRKFYHGRLRRTHAWDGGYPGQTARMQDTAEGFGQPIKHIFKPFLHIYLEVPKADDKNPHYRIQIADRLWHVLYLPLKKSIFYIAKWVSKLQQGRISSYLIYSFITLLILLWWVL